MKKIISFVLTICTVGILFAAARPSLDGRALVAEAGAMPKGLFARTIGYLPGDSVHVTNPATGSSVDVLVLGAIDPSEGVAILLSPEAAEALNIKKDSNVQVKITKREGSLEDSVYGTAVLAEEPASESAAPAAETSEEAADELSADNALTPLEEGAATPEEAVAEEALATEAVAADESVSEEEAAAEPVSEEAAVAETEAEPVTETEPVTEEAVASEPVTEEAASALEAVSENEPVDESAPETEETAEPVSEEALPPDEDTAAEPVEAESLPEEETAEPVAEETPDEVVEETPVDEQPVVESVTEAEPEPIEEEPTEEEEETAYQPIILVPAEPNPPVEETEPLAVPEETVSEEAAVEETDELVATEVAAEDDGDVPVVILEETAHAEEETACAEADLAEESAPESVLAPVAKPADTLAEYTVPSLKELLSGCYYVQIAALSDTARISELLEKYATTYPMTLVPLASGKGYQVMVGPLTADEYGSIQAKFKAFGFKDAFIRKIR